MSSAFLDLSVKQLRRAVEIREKIESLQEELAGILGGSGSAKPAKRGRKPGVSVPALTVGRKPKRQMSDEARAKIAAAQRARWAKAKAAKA